jgi:four helix bundle protein
MSKNSYRDLVAWQSAMNLVDEIYSSVRSFPEYELFGLATQMRTAAISIPCNIAEGHGRFSLRDFRHFLRQARASVLELETEIMICSRQKYIDPDRETTLLEQTARVGQLINGLIRHLSKRLSED